VERGQTQPGAWGPLARLSLAAGSFAVAVSVGLFMYTISQLAGPIVDAGFIAGGIVGRRRSATPAGQALALGTIAGGLVAAVGAVALAAAGR
jgi:hypothetical protein